MSLNHPLAERLQGLPEQLQKPTKIALEALHNQLNQQQMDALVGNERFRCSVAQVFCCSQFVKDQCLRNPDSLVDLVQTGDLFSGQRRNQFAEAISLESIDSDAVLMQSLRQFRNREMVRIAWRDLAGWAELNETMHDLTGLAEVSIQTALQYYYQQACNRRGVPLLKDGRAFNLVVLGMGKLGAYELNYSSDIDLIFAYVEDGELNDRKQTTYGEFFTRICRSVVKALDEITVDGFVFRTDVRLRPFGDSGPLIMTFDGMEKYYMTQAREWERYAMIKARQVAGDVESGNQLAAMIKPFVYRRYLDYGAFEELRSLKFQITQELRRKDRMENIKLGSGGIREIEFIGQAFQLIRGGQDLELQYREILTILSKLADKGIIDQQDVDQLMTSYVFLRRVENHIQQYQDKQTHDLPTDPLAQTILAFSMNYADWDTFKLALDEVRKKVHEVFDSVFSVTEQNEEQKVSKLIWDANEEQSTLIKYLAELGFVQCSEVLSDLLAFKNSTAVLRLTTKGAGVLDRLMPQLLETVQHIDNQDETLNRILYLLEAVAGRNVYLSLLSENPDALNQLVTLSSASQWICEYLAEYPVLFDELLDSRSLYEPLNREGLRKQLAMEMQQVHGQDIEQLMIRLRQFKHVNVLRVAATDIMDVIPLMVVSDYLTYIAEVILETVLEKSWKILTDKHGYPPGTHDENKGFGVLGLGKLGGLELGYSSDLDIVYLYDCVDGNAMTNGDKSIGTTQFYIRLGQKIRHILDTKMLSGILYEVDLRLRPSGDSGLLVTHIDSYQDYLINDAWTWEHQALVRGRFITGDKEIKQKYNQIRANILSLPRQCDELKKEVREMRQKMRDNLAPKDGTIFDLKQSKGGIADIEFIVQFGVLANTAKNQTIAQFTDNIRLLEGLAEHGFFTHETAEFLKKAYCCYRDYGHRQVLQGRSAQSDNIEFSQLSSQVSELWDKIMES